MISKICSVNEVHGSFIRYLRFYKGILVMKLWVA